jgi:hypothetical protein
VSATLAATAILAGVVGWVNWLVSVDSAHREWWRCFASRRFTALWWVAAILGAASGEIGLLITHAVNLRTGVPQIVNDSTATAAIALILRSDFRTARSRDARNSALMFLSRAVQSKLDVLCARHRDEWISSLEGELLIDECWDAHDGLPGATLTKGQAEALRRVETMSALYRANLGTANDDESKARAALHNCLKAAYAPDRARAAGRVGRTLPRD